MERRTELTKALSQVFQRFATEPAQDVLVDSKPLRGGIEASDVTLVTVRYRNQSNRPQVFRLVAKRLTGRPAREASIYQRLVAAYAWDLAPGFWRSRDPVPGTSSC